MSKNSSSIDRLPQVYSAIAIFLGGMLFYIIWRWSLFIVWDDTSSVSSNMYGNQRSLDHLAIIFRESFSYIRGDGYRPFHHIFRSIGNAYVYSRGVNTPLFISLNGFLAGLAALVYYQLTGFFLSTKAARIFALFLFFSSTPVLSGVLILLSGYQLQLYVCFLLIFVVYLNYDISERKRWLLALGVLLLLGPWIHEFIGLAAILIIVREIIFSRGVRLVGIIACIGFLHALLPTLLVSVFVDNLPVVFVFQIGNLGSALSSDGGFISLVSQLHWRVFGDIFSIMPPSLMVFGVFVFCHSSMTYWKASPQDFRNQLFLAIFFFTAFLPFLKVFNEHVHLAYCLIPLSILLAWQAEFVFGLLKTKPIGRLSIGVALLLVVVVFDHAINIVSTRQVTREMYKIIILLADKFKEELPAGTVIVSNAHHIEDIRFYSRGHIDPWNSGGAIPDRSHWLRGDAKALQAQLHNWRGRDVYFLDMRLPRIQGQRGQSRIHSFVRDQIVDMEDLGQIASMRYSYPFFDPLRFLLPLVVEKWPGPPDLEFDYYRGPALSGALFMSEVALDYFFYKVIGDKVRIWTTPTLLAENIQGFNVVGYRDIVYAIPQPEGSFDLNRVQRKGYTRTFQGADLESVVASIMREVPSVTWKAPTLLAENVHGFNVVGYNELVYAIPQSEGAFDLDRLLNKGYSQYFQGIDFITVLTAIEKAFSSL
jgi:hypothetical protein